MERANSKQGHRWYRSDGGDYWLPSVTSILSVYPKGKQFERWLGESDSYEEAIGKRDAAGERGTAVHGAIADLIGCGEITLPTDTDPKVVKLVQGFVNWWREYEPEVIASEFLVAGVGYAGQCDLLCRIGSEEWVIDYKTSSGVYPSYHLQTAAYAWAAKDEGLAHTIPRRGTLWLKTSTKKGWQLVESPHVFDDDYTVFQACQTLFHYEYGDQPEFAEEKAAVTSTFRLEEE